MTRIRRIRLPSLWTPLLLCLYAVATGAYAQDHPQAVQEENVGCSSWEIEDGCSEGDTLKINGISLYYAENFNRILPELSKHFRVITPDSRAQGRSTDSDEPLSYRLFVDDMVDLLDSLGIDSAYVGGASDGAAIAIHMALYHPERVRPLLLGPVDLSPEALTEVFWGNVEQFALPEKLTTLWFETRISPTQEELAAIQVPTLFVIGEEEQYVKLDHVAWQYESIPTAEVVWIPDADHSQFVSKPDEVSQEILSFLNRHR